MTIVPFLTYPVKNDDQAMISWPGVLYNRINVNCKNIVMKGMFIVDGS
jgi:hypothetical protein